MAQQNCTWVLKMADLLVLEILQQMCGIQMMSRAVEETAHVAMDTVYGFVDGEYRMQLWFRAEPRIFGRIAGNMMGKSPQQQDIQDYAEEFFNVLCGRFVSEIYQTTQMKARFLPTHYGVPPKESCEIENKLVCTRCFISEDQELAEFSWCFLNNNLEV